jgi:hypothetical protein
LKKAPKGLYRPGHGGTIEEVKGAEIKREGPLTHPGQL